MSWTIIKSTEREIISSSLVLLMLHQSNRVYEVNKLNWTLISIFGYHSWLGCSLLFAWSLLLLLIWRFYIFKRTFISVMRSSLLGASNVFIFRLFNLFLRFQKRWSTTHICKFNCVWLFYFLCLYFNQNSILDKY